MNNPGALVYGVVAVGALLAAESTHFGSYLQTVASVMIAVALYWLAHTYAEFAAHRLRRGETLSAAHLAHVMAEEFPIVLGASIPLLAVLGGWAAGASLGSAVSIAIWTDVGLIVAIEVAAGFRARLAGHQLLTHSALGTLLGLLVIALRFVLQ
jgi:hypothetical protein